MLDCALTATSCRVASHRSGLGRLQSQASWLVGSRGRGLLRWAWPDPVGVAGLPGHLRSAGPSWAAAALQQFGLPSRLCLRPPPGGAHDLLSSWLLRRRSRVRVGGPVTCRARAWGAGPASVTDAIGLWLPATDTDPERHGGRGVYRGDASETEGRVRLGAGASSMSSAAGEGQPVTSRRPLRLNGRSPSQVKHRRAVPTRTTGTVVTRAQTPGAPAARVSRRVPCVLASPPRCSACCVASRPGACQLTQCRTHPLVPFLQTSGDELEPLKFTCAQHPACVASCGQRLLAGATCSGGTRWPQSRGP